MKFNTAILAACAAGLMMSFAPAFAADEKAAAPAAAPAAAAKAPAAKLTEADVKKICAFRAQGNAKRETGCVNKHKDKVGKDISPLDARTLANSDKPQGNNKKKNKQVN